MSGIICLTEATIDDEIVSEKRSEFVFALHLNPSPAPNKHAHIKPCTVAVFDLILLL